MSEYVSFSYVQSTGEVTLTLISASEGPLQTRTIQIIVTLDDYPSVQQF